MVSDLLVSKLMAIHEINTVDGVSKDNNNEIDVIDEVNIVGEAYTGLF